MAKRRNKAQGTETLPDRQAGIGATVGYEAQLWQMADALRGSMDATEYLPAPVCRRPATGRPRASRQAGKHVVLGLIFLKYIDLEADFILANPPFNVSDLPAPRLRRARQAGWGGERLQGDKRWQYGAPPTGNANFAWVQHIVHHLAPAGVAGFVLANGSMSSNQSGEGEIRKRLIESGLVDCMVALPGQLFYSTQIPACLWFVSRNKAGQPPSPGASRHPLPVGEGQGVRVLPIFGIVEVRYFSLMPGRWAEWWTAPTAS